MTVAVRRDLRMRVDAFVETIKPYPDVVLRCGPIAPDGYAKDPVFPAEILSPSTIDHDRGGKIRFYKAIPALRTILIVDRDEYRIEAWQRGSDDMWQPHKLGLSDAFDIPTLALSVAVGDIYDGVLV